MTMHARRRFLQTTVAAGAVLAVGNSGLPQSTPSTPPTGPGTGANGNPAVQPGRLRWHCDFAAACGAARESRKPVFLLHMMGRLDQQFC